MNAVGAMRTLMLADAAVDALLGNRIYPVMIPKEVALPCARISRTMARPVNVKNHATDLEMVDIQLSVFAKTYKSAHETTEACRAAVERFYGAVVVGSTNAIIGGIRYDGTSDGYEPEGEVFHVISEYMVRWHKSGAVNWTTEAGILPYITETDQSTLALTVGANRLIEKIIIRTDVACTPKAGWAANGEDVMRPKAVAANVPLIAEVDRVSASLGATVHFSGLAGNVRIVVHTRQA